MRAEIGALGGDASHVTLAREPAGGRGDVHARRRQGPHRHGPGQPGPEDRGPGHADRRPAGRRRPGRPGPEHFLSASGGPTRWPGPRPLCGARGQGDLLRRALASTAVRRRGCRRRSARG
ncbi:hypothetical protein [Kitasatospora sp. NPDC056531]|uniref:hypothetical protein n=1 Tax=Kitasatospora sp. NPDC056531 TaxID=3345856 RepID=UPI0036A24E11